MHNVVFLGGRYYVYHELCNILGVKYFYTMRYFLFSGGKYYLSFVLRIIFEGK